MKGDAADLKWLDQIEFEIMRYAFMNEGATWTNDYNYYPKDHHLHGEWG